MGERVAIRQPTESQVRGSAETMIVRNYAGRDPDELDRAELDAVKSEDH